MSLRSDMGRRITRSIDAAQEGSFLDQRDVDARRDNLVGDARDMMYRSSGNSDIDGFVDRLYIEMNTVKLPEAGSSLEEDSRIRTMLALWEKSISMAKRHTREENSPVVEGYRPELYTRPGEEPLGQRDVDARRDALIGDAREMMYGISDNQPLNGFVDRLYIEINTVKLPAAGSSLEEDDRIRAMLALWEKSITMAKRHTREERMDKVRNAAPVKAQAPSSSPRL